MPRRSLSKQLRDVRKVLRNAVDRDLISLDQMKKVGLKASELVVKRTRQGRGVNRADGGGNTSPLKQLTERYINYRKQNRFRLHPDTSPGKSNLTFSGQMLDSFTVRQTSKGRVFIGPGGRRSGGGPTNAQVGQFVIEQGRVFNNLSRGEIRELAKFYQATFPRIARRNGLKVK